METTTSQILEKIKNSSKDKLFSLVAQLRKEGVKDRHIDRTIQEYIDIETKKYYQKAKDPKEIGELLAEILKVTPSADSKAEMVFAELLSGSGIKFKFQYQIGPYRVDFLIHDNIVLEIDGPHHKSQVEYDNKRDKYLEKMGYSVLRVPIRILVIDPQAVISGIIELRNQQEHGGLK